MVQLSNTVDNSTSRCKAVFGRILASILGKTAREGAKTEISWPGHELSPGQGEPGFRLSCLLTLGAAARGARGDAAWPTYVWSSQPP
jgi:hypothetical protein